MQTNELQISPVFTQVPYLSTIEVHDFELHSDGSFDYVTEDLVGKPVDPAFVTIVRPIVGQPDILDMLQHNVCVCGDYKGRRKSHCSRCYFSLPEANQKSLYRRFRDGYEQAFLSSLEYLIQNGRTTVDKILSAVPKPKGN